MIGLINLSPQLSVLIGYSRATTNESVAGGVDIPSATEAFFPSLTNEGVNRLEQVSLLQ